VASFPTPAHRAAAEKATTFLSALPEVDAVLLVGSCARRPDANDLDVTALVKSGVRDEDIRVRWEPFARESAQFAELSRLGDFRSVDLDVTDGSFAPGYHGWTSGPDEFELEIGNYVAYSVTLWQRADRIDRLRAEWLPFYADDLRATRLADVCMFCRNNLDHIPSMLERDEPFHAFHRLYLAFHEFLQALFISRRTYPIAYDKWVREQVEDILGLPELYAELPQLFDVGAMDRAKLAANGGRLERLLADWVE
jgi:hypothetical protein